MTKISQLSDIGGSLAAGDEFVIRDVSDISTPNKKVTASGFIDYVIAQGVGSGFTQISAGVGPLARVLASSSGTTGTVIFSTASAGSLLERARIDSAGRLLVGVATARADFSTIAPQFQIENTSVAGARFSLTRNAESAGAAEIFLGKTRSSVNGGSTVVSSGDSLGGVGFWGADGTSLIPGASINAAVDGTPGTNDMPGRLVFSTTADGSASPTERMRISANGAVNVVGSLSKGSGSFKINHPLSEKTDTHYLVHSFIEGPQADLIYRGHVQLVDGLASINIDEAARMTEGTFESLCANVCCFTTNESDWTAVRGAVTGNILAIEAQDASCTAEVCWMVIGERQDVHMMETEWTDDNGRVIVEPIKPMEPEISDTINSSS